MFSQHSLAADGWAHHILCCNLKVWVPHATLILREGRGERLSHHTHPPLPAARLQPLIACVAFGGGQGRTLLPARAGRCASCAVAGNCQGDWLPRAGSCCWQPTHLARAISSIASVLITCTTYSGVPTNSASRIARPVASPSNAAGRDRAWPSGPVIPESNTRCWPSATASPFSACTCRRWVQRARRWSGGCSRLPLLPHGI